MREVKTKSNPEGVARRYPLPNKEFDPAWTAIKVADGVKERSEGPYCSNFFLHKFRHTFATRNLRDHVCDIKTLQNWMGHKDLASTMVYLKLVRNKDVMARVNSSELAALVV